MKRSLDMFQSELFRAKNLMEEFRKQNETYKVSFHSLLMIFIHFPLESIGINEKRI